MRPETTDQTLRRHYARTALAKLGIPFERGMESKAVRIAVEGAARAEDRLARLCEMSRIP